MDINLDFFKPFTDYLERLKEKYNPKFEMINGLIVLLLLIGFLGFMAFKYIGW